MPGARTHEPVERPWSHPAREPPQERDGEIGLQPADFEAGTLHADHEITPYGEDEKHTAVAGPE
ncbi:hypothetical protein ACFWNT_01560, partial [Streptomyces sp. NPDC058409]|uniref:hypothetical protein n=1 Tax=Streptomyces sp. NPDC058409 TaxID=3346484 RepID=UPI00365D69B4